MTYVHNEILLFTGFGKAKRESSRRERKIGNAETKNSAADPIPAS
jgi:hypothetical protein